MIIKDEKVQDYDLIETPENVELQRRLAGIGSRFIAGFLDNLLIVLMYLVLFILLASHEMQWFSSYLKKNLW